MPNARIHIMKHTKTGLLAAMSEDLAGFVVHAHTEEELFGKLGTAFKHFMEGIGTPVTDVNVVKDSPEGFWPPSFVASGKLEKEAA